MGRDLSRVEPVDQQMVAESVPHSWYHYENGDAAGKHPWEGETDPRYEGPKPPFETLEGFDKYSWLKAPRYDGEPMEVGPLARMLVAYASGHPDVTAGVTEILSTLNVGAEALFSTLGRIAARALETKLLAGRMSSWLSDLEANIGTGDLAIADVSHWDPSTWPDEALGFGMEEAPRGSLGHWIVIKDRVISNYQLVVPSTWNGSPRDGDGRRGAWEEALIGTPVADATKPVEILRTVHSFDPCMACAVHVFDPEGGSSVELQIV